MAADNLDIKTGEQEPISCSPDMISPKKPQITVVYKPLPSSKKTSGEAPSPTVCGSNAYLRAENEDDDGYDPYSDRREEAPLFERNPWD